MYVRIIYKMQYLWMVARNGSRYPKRLHCRRLGKHSCVPRCAIEWDVALLAVKPQDLQRQSPHIAAAVMTRYTSMKELKWCATQVLNAVTCQRTCGVVKKIHVLHTTHLPCQWIDKPFLVSAPYAQLQRCVCGCVLCRVEIDLQVIVEAPLAEVNKVACSDRSTEAIDHHADVAQECGSRLRRHTDRAHTRAIPAGCLAGHSSYVHRHCECAAIFQVWYLLSPYRQVNCSSAQQPWYRVILLICCDLQGRNSQQ